ncbi:MAG: response regulator [Thermoplasmatota archaeon]
MSKVILIVDDEPMIHELLGAHLKRMDTPVELYHAESGEDAVEQYRSLMEQEKQPDLVVMDLNLSGAEDMDAVEQHKAGSGEMDGVRTTEELLNIDADVRIWGYTAWFGTDWSNGLDVYAEKIVERTVPFHEFAEMVDGFFKQKDAEA